MRPSRRRRIERLSRLEPVEPRLLLSAQPVADDCLDAQISAAASPLSLAGSFDLAEIAAQAAGTGLTGSGQTVAVIDSGIAYTHEALGSGYGEGYRVVGGWDFSENDADPFDDASSGSHGTHVAGIIGGDSSTLQGVATGVDLVALRVFNDSGFGSFSWIEEALQWVHQHRGDFENPITTVNLSVGSNWNASTVPDWSTIEDELAQLYRDGIFVAVAAGNSFTSTYTTGLSYPAASSYVVPVASVDSTGDLSYFSQRSDRVIAALGRGVLSAVPDYLGDGNGVDDDYTRYSGTSMASPYVAGAAVLLREAYALAGIDSVTQDTLHNLMCDTADLVYDSITQASYYRLNLASALEAILPDDDFGSALSTAGQLGTVLDRVTQEGVLGTGGDEDWFTFTAGATGRAVIGLEGQTDFAATWSLPGGGALSEADGGVALQVVAGQSYTIALGGTGDAGRYTLEITLEPSDGGSNWGTLAQRAIADQTISGQGERYTLVASRSGILTIEAFFSNAAGDIDLALYDESGKLLAGSYSMGDSERIDVAVTAGQRVFLRAYGYGNVANPNVDFRVTNLVGASVGRVQVWGTGGDDAFTFQAGSTWQLSVNGVEYQGTGSTLDSLTIHGQGGNDTATLRGTAGDERVLFDSGRVRLLGEGWLARTDGIETVEVVGGGGDDRAILGDTAGDDTLQFTPSTFRLAGEGYGIRGRGFGYVRVTASAGGADVARFYDSEGSDVFVGTPQYARFVGAGFFQLARGFEVVHAFSSAGGDIARLYDSEGNDTCIGSPEFAKLYGNGYCLRVVGFALVHGFASTGSDLVRLFDSSGDDTLIETLKYAKLYGSDFFLRAVSFDDVESSLTAGGTDTRIARVQALAAEGVSLASAGTSSGVSSAWGDCALFQAMQEEDADSGDAATDDPLQLLAAIDYLMEQLRP